MNKVDLNLNVCTSGSEFLYRATPSPREVTLLFFYFSLHVIGVFELIISLSLTNMFSFLAHITCLISEQLLNATVGGSVLINCSLPGYPLTFYWQEDGEKNVLFHWKDGNEIIEKNKYEKRSQIFRTEFSSRNISIKLHNISVEDDEKTFFAIVNLYKEPNITKSSQEKQCRSRLQVSGNFRSFLTPNLSKSLLLSKSCKYLSCSFCHTHSSLPGSEFDS